MDGDFLQRQTLAVFEHYAEELGVASGWWEGGGITFVERSPDYVWPYVALVLTAARGSVVSVAPGLIDIAREHQPNEHFSVVYPHYLRHLAATAATDGRSVVVSGESICWALRSVPPAPVLPQGLEFEVWERERMVAEMAVRRFENGLGKPGVAGRDFRNKWAIAAVNSSGEPMAIAGVFATAGLDEIGVDVVAEAQGQGLGVAVVAAATREILERGGTPFYGCGAHNVRSQRTAMRVGFVPVFTDANVS